MPKPMYVWTGTAWVSVASEVESLATYATQSYADNQPGMKLVVPTSVAVGSGSGSVATQGTVTFSGATSVSLNNCFNSTYDNYRLMIEISSASADASVNLRLRASGSDQSGASYDTALYGAQSNGTAFAFNSSGGTVLYTGDIDAANSYFGYAFTIDAYRPNKNDRTLFTITSAYIRQAGTFAGISGGGIYNSAYVADGLTLLNSASATMSGTIRVYGYKAG